MRTGMFKSLAFGIVATALSTAAGCAIEPLSDDDPATDTSTAEVTVGVTNNVVADTLFLRSGNATNGPIIGTMGFCTTFFVSSVDWNTRMAFGHSNSLGKSGWARISDGANVYLTAGPCITGGGEGKADSPGTLAR